MTDKQAATVKTKRVVIAEDYLLVRQGLVFMLQEEGMNVVGQAENGQEVIALVSDFKPDVVLMDIGMPVMDGITATRQIKEAHPEVKVIMLTSHDAPDEVSASLAAGADAYCMKDIPVERLCQVMEVIEDGAVWLDPAIARAILKQLPPPGEARSQDSPADAVASAGAPLTRKRYNADLTEREREVLGLIVDGKSNKEIAQALHVTIHTAKAHVANIIQKLAVDDRTQVAVKALREGLLEESTAE